MTEATILDAFLDSCDTPGARAAHETQTVMDQSIAAGQRNIEALRRIAPVASDDDAPGRPDTIEEGLANIARTRRGGG